MAKLTKAHMTAALTSLAEKKEYVVVYSVSYSNYDRTVTMIVSDEIIAARQAREWFRADKVKSITLVREGVWA